MTRFAQRKTASFSGVYILLPIDESYSSTANLPQESAKGGGKLDNFVAKGDGKQDNNVVIFPQGSGVINALQHGEGLQVQSDGGLQKPVGEKRGGRQQRVPNKGPGLKQLLAARGRPSKTLP